MEVVELKQILENEKLIAMGEGDIPVVISITAIQGISTNIQFSNMR